HQRKVSCRVPSTSKMTRSTGAVIGMRAVFGRVWPAHNPARMNDDHDGIDGSPAHSRVGLFLQEVAIQRQWKLLDCARLCSPPRLLESSMSFLSMHPKSFVTGLAAVLALSFGTRSADASIAPQGPITAVQAQEK